MIPLVFRPLFMERIWGSRSLEKLYGKALPPEVSVGESWELVDRPEAQSIVEFGPDRGRSLQDLWLGQRAEIFGEVEESERFPLLIKLLDAHETLSLQVHPPAPIARELGGEPKTEFWYISHAQPGAELFAGLKNGCTAESLKNSLASGAAEKHLHRIPVRAGDAMFLPSGRLHAIGAGNVIVEVQQNSDTTYRVFDWNRVDAAGVPRQLHLEQSLRSIAFEDYEPGLVEPAGESLVRHKLFVIEKWPLEAPRSVSEWGTFAVLVCLTGKVEIAGVQIGPGELCLVPAALKDRLVRPAAEKTTLLHITIPPSAADA